MGKHKENKLRELRGKKSQDQIAEIFQKKYGISTVRRQQISRWERGPEKPSLENAVILMEIYNVLDKESINKIKETFGLE